MNFLDQFSYVNRVVNSCQTEGQRQNALKWAEDWAKRMKAAYPKSVHSHVDLYLSVIAN
jgi:hypothetical protein